MIKIDNSHENKERNQNSSNSNLKNANAHTLRPCEMCGEAQVGNNIEIVITINKHYNTNDQQDRHSI